MNITDEQVKAATEWFKHSRGRHFPSDEARARDLLETVLGDDEDDTTEPTPVVNTLEEQDRDIEDLPGFVVPEDPATGSADSRRGIFAR